VRVPDFRRPPSRARLALLAGLAGAALAAGTTAVVLGTGGDGGAPAAAPAPSSSPAAPAEDRPAGRESMVGPSPAESSVPASPDAGARPDGEHAGEAGDTGDGDRAGQAGDGDGAAGSGAARPSGALFVNPHGQARQWVDSHSGDHRREVIAERIASQPQGVWFTSYDPGGVTGDVRAVTAAAEDTGTTPVLVSYVLPQRDCGGASSGGAPDLAAYDAWMAAFAAGLGDGPVIVILEPDSIALSDCLTDGERDARFASLARAGRTLHDANPQARVYYDAGHSQWHDPADIAGRLASAGVRSGGDGIFTNVANYRTTADETAYARDVLAALGDDRLGAVVDTSRNGNGPVGEEWCDPEGRRIGHAPTTDTGDPAIDAYLWVKPPGEADGCAEPAGTFSPDLAYQLATG
jgi:endoglucanase